jgi:RNA polymerase sigma factor (sigma-70 family)
MPLAQTFRHEYARLVALLCKRYGMHQLDKVEDAVQSAMEKALRKWPSEGEPNDPSAWLYRVANNVLLDMLRRQEKLDPHSPAQEPVAEINVDTATLPSEVGDETLRMLFVTCDPALPSESQVVFALKILCGFSIREIALRLMITEANAYKRYSRACSKLRHVGRALDLPPAYYASRLPTVRSVIYLLFTEGYLSSHEQFPLRKDFCDEALYLAQNLHSHSLGNEPETEALIALMYLHRSRMNARADHSGALVLLANQDRTLWDQADIQRGLYFLQLSARGDEFTRFHAEAGIAAEHCLSPTYEKTNWQKIVELYDMLDSLHDSPLQSINKAVALAEWQGAKSALEFLTICPQPSWLAQSYLWYAVKADLYLRVGDTQEYSDAKKQALALAPSQAIKEALCRRWQ